MSEIQLFSFQTKGSGGGLWNVTATTKLQWNPKIIAKEKDVFFFLDAFVFDQKVKDLIFNNMPRDLIIAFGKKKPLWRLINYQTIFLIEQQKSLITKIRQELSLYSLND